MVEVRRRVLARGLMALTDLPEGWWPLLPQRRPAKGRPHNSLDGLVCCHHKATWGKLMTKVTGAAWGIGEGRGGAGPQQLTSWASEGRCPEASRGPACPWGTCPPTAPGGPEEEGTWQVSSQLLHCSPLPPNLCSDKTHFINFHPWMPGIPMTSSIANHSF